MADGPGPNRAQERLLHGLLTLDLEFRIGRGESPDPLAYLERFPEYSTAILEVFADFGHGQAQAPLPEHRNQHSRPGYSGGKPGAGHAIRGGAAAGRAQLRRARGLAVGRLRDLRRARPGRHGRRLPGAEAGAEPALRLKMILAGPHAGSAAAARFRTEAEAVARLRHPNIVQIYHVGEADGLPFLELEYLPGGSLDRALDGTPTAPDEAARLVEALARAIAEAHGKGIVHRDLKPANVLLDADGSPKIADFGLAKLLDSDSDLTRTQTVLGSPSYMAPEQAEGRSHLAGPATDVYALGAILYELLTGRPPFRAATALETLAQVKSTEPVPPSRLQPGLPRDLETICLKCLEKAPGAAVRPGRATWPRICAASWRASRSWPARAGLGAGLEMGPAAAGPRGGAGRQRDGPRPASERGPLPQLAAPVHAAADPGGRGSGRRPRASW